MGVKALFVLVNLYDARNTFVGERSSSAAVFFRHVERAVFEYEVAEGVSSVPFPRPYTSNKGQRAYALLLSFPTANIVFSCTLHNERQGDCQSTWPRKSTSGPGSRF